MYRPMIRLSAAKRPWGFQKSSVSLLKRCRGFTETHRPFSKSSASFSHRGRWNHPLTKPIIPSFRSSLHISQNTLSINRLIMTGYPFILLSVVLPKLLSNLPSVFICIKKVLQMKGGWKDNTRCPFTTEIRHNRAFQRLMKGGRKRQIFPFVWRKTQLFFYEFSHCTASHFGYFTITVYFLHPLPPPPCVL